MTRTVALLPVGLVLAGCAAVHSPHDRSTVSEELAARTGHSLRAAPDSGAELPDGVVLEDGLTEDEAVAVALWRNADLEVTLAGLGLAKADLVEAGLLRNPVFSLLFPLGPKQLEFTLSWPIEAIWQRPRRVAAAQVDVARAAEELVEGGLDLVRDTRLDYVAMLLEEERAHLAVEALGAREQIAAIADAQARLGDISALEAAAVQVEAARARDDTQRAARSLEASRDRLLSRLGLHGLPGSPEIRLVPGAPEIEGEVPELSRLLEEAFAARPELRAVELAMEAAGERAGIARSEILNLSALLDANEEGKEGFEIGPGVAIEIPLFGKNKGRLARAEAELALHSRRYVAVRERIDLEVRQARTALLGARESVAVWDSSVLPALEQRLERLDAARAGGDASRLEVLVARRSLLDARLLLAEARAAERRAETALAHAVGRAVDFSAGALQSQARP